MKVHKTVQKAKPHYRPKKPCSPNSQLLPRSCELRLQWHPAFYAGIQIEFEKDASNLIFENEHQLGTKPKQIDILITKKDPSIPIHSNLGKIFRKYNIIEYKSPSDYPSIDDFSRALAYVYFFKSESKHVDEISLSEITLTLVCQKYPQKLIQYLKEIWGCTLVPVDQGIYRISGHVIPIQIILTAQLSGENNFWLRNLTNTITSDKTAKKLIAEYEKHKSSRLYQSVMDIIVRANQKTFTGGMYMCQAIMELDFVKEKMNICRKEGMEQGLTNGRIQSFIEDYQEFGISLNDTISRLKTKFSLDEETSRNYINLYWK